MKIMRFGLLITALFLGTGVNSCKISQWESLFNGKDLEGWVVRSLPADQAKSYWTVKEGFIECNSMGDRSHNYVWLATEREFGNFHLKLKFQVFKESEGNSGVQFRSRYDDSETALYKGWMNGPQVDIHGPDPYRAGLIYDETDGVRRWIYPPLPDWNISREQAPSSALDTRLVYYEDDPEAWNDMEIICNGMVVETRINGNQVTLFDGKDVLNDEVHQFRKSGGYGCIAFQLHMGDELKIRFKDIYIK
jgi:hypothetical protein